MTLSAKLRNLAAASLWLHPRAQKAVLRAVGFRLGSGTFISPPVTFRGSKVSTGPGCYLNSGVFVGRGSLTLGSNVFVGPGVMFITDSHEMGPAAKRAGRDIEEPIQVGDGVWLGARAVVLGNVNIAPGCVIGAGAVVTKSTEPNGLYLGAPARRARDLPE